MTHQKGIYTTASYDQLNFEVIKNNIELILPSNTILIVKLHPQANEADFKIPAKLNHQIKVLPKKINVDIKDLIFSSEVLLTYRSFTNFEAMCLNRPVITIKLDNNIPEGRAILRTENHGFLFCDKIKDLSKNLNDLINSEVFKFEITKKQKDFIEKTFFSKMDKPTNRIIEILQKKINDS